jgi:hypothetical protein
MTITFRVCYQSCKIVGHGREAPHLAHTGRVESKQVVSYTKTLKIIAGMQLNSVRRYACGYVHCLERQSTDSMAWASSSLSLLSLTASPMRVRWCTSACRRAATTSGRLAATLTYSRLRSLWITSSCFLYNTSEALSCFSEPEARHYGDAHICGTLARCLET